ncbi:fumarylpyruvate hydrolase [Pseudochelatococcus lubricantis]|uniref:Fumarylpyruvate hydrolase n=1 Tax=Pseudochelatococcus lubricantis TaxID=1538102 RepID=A0ABX0UW32_9HYPH|nr:fumarylacetoacetate hydrolase family protein [Pseudochelatococcus lubricantis]NIJ56608.1 fumarylpyruvate hydrolase [Pseudochelatococcus lubricantis]
MQELVFPPPVAPTLPVRGLSARLPVRRIFCAGRNYAAHALELGAEAGRSAPFFFTKSPSALAQSGETIPYPPGTRNYQYELELVLCLGSHAFRVSESEAVAAVYGYACGLDMTRRDLQRALRAAGQPWDLGKDVEASAVVAEITPAADFGVPDGQRIWLSVDDELRQDAHLSDMLCSPMALIAELSKFYHLAPGDLIFTGTPAGVAPLAPGARIRGQIEGLTPVEVTIGEPE